MTCPYCGRPRHPCPYRDFPAHVAPQGRCDGWLHGNGAHACTPLGWRQP